MLSNVLPESMNFPYDFGTAFVDIGLCESILKVQMPEATRPKRFSSYNAAP